MVLLNSLGPSDAIWHWISWSTLVQVMARCLMAPSHYLNQCWLIISKVLWHSSEDIIIRRFEDTNQSSKIEKWHFQVQVFKCFIYPTEVHDIIYNLYVVRLRREGGQRSIAYRAVHLNTKTLIHEYCKLLIYHSRILNDIENSTKRKKAKVLKSH